ncbi:MAG: SDR family NAD(P)-dependent oxidoreductase [Christensenella sp.]|nr:SDR family NAD(P)-dependent oxidoreductase [Christensenella sp.]
MEYTNKKIVITGASSGIGLGLLKNLSEYPGTQVVGVARHTEAIHSLNRANVTALSYDMSDPKAIDSMLADCSKTLGEIDIFFANAGFAYYGEIGSADWDKIKNIFAVNVFAPIYTLQKINAMQPKKRWQYVITDSALAKVAIPGFSLYSSTKYAVDGFVGAYRFEKPANIILSTIYPVATKTHFFKQAGTGTPLPSPTQTAEQVVKAVLHDVRREKKNIYPFRSFGFFNWLWNFLPFLKRGYLALEDNKFKKWEQTQSK